jgi:hypothetical protein
MFFSRILQYEESQVFLGHLFCPHVSLRCSNCEGKSANCGVSSPPHVSGFHSCFIFGMSQAKISAWRPAILTEGFHGFTQPLQANGGLMLP